MTNWNPIWISCLHSWSEFIFLTSLWEQNHVLKYNSSVPKGSLWWAEGMAEVFIFLLLKHFPFPRTGCLMRQILFSYPCFTADFGFYLFVNKGSVVCLVVSHLHWLWTRWTEKSRRNKGRCIYMGLLSHGSVSSAVAGTVETTVPIQQSVVSPASSWASPLSCSRWQQFVRLPSTAWLCWLKWAGTLCGLFVSLCFLLWQTELMGLLLLLS